MTKELKNPIDEEDLSGLADVLRQIADQLSPEKAPSQDGVLHLCKRVRCSRELELEAAIRDAILAIEKTKSSFRSRALRELREKFVRVLAREEGTISRDA